jgi:phosphatidylglycerophosphatase A
MAIRFIKERNPVNENVKVPFLVNLVGSGLYTGYAPVAQGTVGSFFALLVYLIPGFSGLLSLLAFIIVFFLIGLYAAEKMRLRFGEDAPEVTIDEIVGQWFTYFIGSLIFEIFFTYKQFDPGGLFLTKLAFAFIGFLVFRFFDIMKIEPAKYFDDKDSGLGIMMDDIVSAFYAGILSAVVTHFIWYKFLIRILV